MRAVRGMGLMRRVRLVPSNHRCLPRRREHRLGCRDRVLFCRSLSILDQAVHWGGRLSNQRKRQERRNREREGHQDTVRILLISHLNHLRQGVYTRGQRSDIFISTKEVKVFNLTTLSHLARDAGAATLRGVGHRMLPAQ